MHDQPKSGISARVTGSNQNEAAAGRDAAQPHPPGEAAQVPPSNTTCDKDNGGMFFQPLRWGVDSLYLSYKGQVDPVVEADLRTLKALAQSDLPLDIAKAQYRIGEHIFQVKDKGAPRFPYILENTAYRIQVPKATSKALPMAYVKVSSALLSAMLPEKVEAEAHAIAQSLGQIKDSARVGRIDMYVDFVSSVDMESWDRSAWVTRASAINSYAVDGKFSGWSIGAGSSMSARLYDKTLEIKTSHKDYLKALWQQAGWDGSRQVWRLEIQIKREILAQCGLKDFRLVNQNLNGLWSYALTEWLRLTIPSPTDQKRSRGLG